MQVLQQLSIHGLIPVRSRNEHEEKKKKHLFSYQSETPKNNTFGEAFGSSHEPSSAQASVGHQPSRASGGISCASPTYVAPVRAKP
ncbi:hypothetical protein M514_04426 [Trichuris suis]|uniref:Uncharacterized protein n=1 Tax=Trichuris suis TaxID=68888 RepID=A0A085MZ50_9BILA|nr:hypothetical protein M513_04426 [Trichuris suis]KFD62496.1 hypothetical protein M514_04426 [Trichuris suis]